MINILIDFLLTLALHEYIHYFFAKKFKRNPELKFEKIMCPCIEYDKSSNNVENCLISMSPLGVHILLILIGNDFLQIINIGFLFMIIPISSDGYIFWSSLIKYITNKYK